MPTSSTKTVRLTIPLPERLAQDLRLMSALKNQGIGELIEHYLNDTPLRHDLRANLEQREMKEPPRRNENSDFSDAVLASCGPAGPAVAAGTLHKPTSASVPAMPVATMEPVPEPEDELPW